MAQSTSQGTLRQVLLPGSRWVDRCEICGRPEILLPVEGGFQLRRLWAGPIETVDAWENIHWVAGGNGLPIYRLRGQGILRQWGQVMVQQEVRLELEVETPQGLRRVILTNVSSRVERHWPILRVQLSQTNGSPVQSFALLVEAAPVRDLWFSTETGFTPGIQGGSGPPRSEGDLVSWEGTVVRSAGDLAGRLGIMPPVPDLGLQSADVRVGGEMVYSVRTRVWSEKWARWLRPGDVLSDQGRVVWAVEDLLAAFQPVQSVEEVGVDALWLGPEGEIWFSITREVPSRHLGRPLHRGDVLSRNGQVIRSYEALLAAFAPAKPGEDPGLDALYVWPHGEIWFSVERAFQDRHGTVYGRGDLLSDRGWVVARNLDLMRRFAPLEDLSDFGLDALVIAADTEGPRTSAGEAPRLTLRRAVLANDLVLDWQASGRFVQLEWAESVTGPWQPRGAARPCTPTLPFEVPKGGSAGFYRLRQW